MRLSKFIAVIFAVILPLSTHGGDTKVITGEINALKVLESMYGKLTIEKGRPKEPAIWRDINLPDDLKKYFSYDKYGEVYVAFEAKYKEKGIEKYILVTQTRPGGDQTYDCHACAPLIGCFVFRRSNNIWIAENKNKYVYIIGKWGWLNKEKIDSESIDKIELIMVGVDKHGVLIRGNDIHQGYENYYIYLIVPYKETLEVSLHEGIEGAGPGACIEPAAKNKQGIYYAFNKNTKSEYYDVTVTNKWNKGYCKKVRSVKEIKYYRFADGKYKEKPAVN
jgi:hypothetical protein